jgi:hypothetical protein
MSISESSSRFIFTGRVSGLLIEAGADLLVVDEEPELEEDELEGEI